MSLFSGLSKFNHLSEFGEPLDTQGQGVLSAAQRKALAIANLGITALAAELNYLDITTLGTGAASKAVVLDGGEDYTWPATGVLTYGVLKDPAGTTLGATVAELNAAADSSANTVVVAAGGGATALSAAIETVLVPLVTANATFALPIPTLGKKLRFLFIGTATEGSEDWILTTAATSFFVGGIPHMVHGTPDIEPVFADGTTHNTLTINTPSAGTEVVLVGVSATQWAVSGKAVAITIPAFSAV